MLDALRSAAWGGTWFVTSTVGLGFALAATECERYTALWNFGTRSLPELAAIVVFLLVGVWLLMRANAMSDPRLYRRTALVGALCAVQVAAMVARLSGVVGTEGVGYILASLGIQCASFTLLLYAEFNLETGVRKSVTSLAAAFMLSGLIQMAATALPRTVALIMVVLLPVAAAALLVVSAKMRNERELASEQEDISVEQRMPQDALGSTKSALAACCASLFLLNVLLIALHSQAMSLQDGSDVSSQIQLFAGLGTVVAGAVFLLAMRKLHEFELLEMLRLLVLPLVVVALYLAMPSGGVSVGVNMVLLSTCYALLILFVWSVPRQLAEGSEAFRGTCMAYIAYRLGWAAGILGIMLVPTFVEGASYQPIVVLALGALVLLSGLQVLRLVRRLGADPQTAQAQADAVPNAQEAYLVACHEVAEAYGLSPREEQVLAIVARGRNARYVSNALMIAEGTARGHITHIYQKLGVRSQQALMDIVDDKAGGVRG